VHVGRQGLELRDRDRVEVVLQDDVFLGGKYRKNVLGETSAASAICSTVVSV